MPALGPIQDNQFAPLQSDDEEEAKEEPYSMVEPEAKEDAKQEAKGSAAAALPESSSTALISVNTPTAVHYLCFSGQIISHTAGSSSTD